MYQRLYQTEQVLTRRLPGRTDIEVLTCKQQEVWYLDQKGLRPSEIAQCTGLGLTRVDNIRRRLRQLGFSPLVWKRHSRRE